MEPNRPDHRAPSHGMDLSTHTNAQHLSGDGQARLEDSQGMPTGATVQPGGRTGPTPLNANQIRQYMDVADRRMRQIIKDWVPRPFTADEQLEYREETQKLIRVIKTLETEKARIAPLVRGAIETNLFMARVEYRVKFSRLFRFNDLPSEIMCNIFRFVVWSSTDHHKSIQARLHLTWVCKRWRKGAEDDTTLWNLIWWKDGPHFTRSKTWLHRSGNAPKDIRISDYGDQPMAVRTLDTILQRIIPRLATIRVLIIVLRDWDAILFALDQLRIIESMMTPMIMERFEMHRSGAVWVQPGPGYVPHQEPMALFGGACISTLRTLSLSAVHVDWARSPLSNLTTLDIRQLPLEKAPDSYQFRAILSNSPMLTKLILDSAGPNFQGRSTDSPDVAPIPLLHLKILAIADFSPSYGVYLLSHFSAPNLRDLTILNISSDDYSPFFAAITGKMPDIRVLTIFNGDLQGTSEELHMRRLAVVKWLESIPKVTFLRFGGMRRIFLETFLCNPNIVKQQYPENKVLCPNMIFFEWQRMDSKTVIEWSQYRKKLGVPFKKMYVNFENPEQVHSEVWKALADSLDVGGEVLLLRPGHKAPEESILQR